MIHCLCLQFLQVSSADCEGRGPPAFFGGLTGATQFDCVDVNHNGNYIAAGGSTSDSGLLGESGTFPILVLYNSAYEIQWKVRYSGFTGLPSAANMVSQVSFENDGDNMAIMIGHSEDMTELVVLGIDKDDGSIVRKKIFTQPSERFYVAQLGLQMDNDKDMYVGGSYNDYFMLLKLNEGDDGYEMITTAATNFGKSFQINPMTGSGKVAFGGQVKKSTTDPNLYTILGIINLSGSPSVVFSFLRDEGVEATADPFEPVAINIKGRLLSLCLNKPGGSTLQFINARMNSPKNTLNTIWTFSYSSSPFICLNIKSENGQEDSSGLIYKTDTDELYLFSLSVLDSTTGKFWLHLISTELDISSLVGGVTPEYETSYFSGSSRGASSLGHTYTQDQGFIMTNDLSSSCLSSSETWSSEISLSVVADAFTSQTVDWAYPTITIEDQTITKTDLTDEVANLSAPCPYEVEFDDISDAEYIIDDGDLTIDMDQFRISEGCDAEFTYTVTLSDGNPLPSFFTVDGSDLEVETDDNDDVDDYEVTVVGSYAGFTASQTFTVSLLHTCSEKDLDLPTINTVTYYHENGSEDVILDEFDVSPADADCTFTYELLNDDDTAIDPAFLSFDPATRTMTVNSDDTREGDDYVLKLRGILDQNTDLYDEVDFTLQIRSLCNLETIVSTDDIEDFEYTIGSGSLTVQTLAWTLSDPSCQDSIEYWLEEESNNLPGFITIDGSLDLIVDSSDPNEGCETYEIEVLGRLGTDTQAIDFSMEVISSSLSLTPSTVTDFSYYVGQGSHDEPIPDFTITPASCTGAVYEITQLSPIQGDLPDFMDFTYPDLNIETNDYSTLGAYTLQVEGKIKDVLESMTFTVNVECDPSTVVTITPPSSIEEQEITVGGENLYIPYGDYTWTPACLVTLTYSLSIDEEASLPSFISLDSDSNQIVIDSSTAVAASYTIRIHAEADDGASTSNDDVTALLVVLAAESPVNNLPLFELDLTDFTMQGSDSKTYTLPGNIDPDGDTVDVTVDLGLASTFITYADGTFSINPTASTIPNTYLIQIELLDSQGGTTSASFTVVVEAPEEEQEEEESEESQEEEAAQNETSDSNSTDTSGSEKYHISTTEAQGESSSSSNQLPLDYSVNKPVKGAVELEEGEEILNISCKISEVTQTGSMTLQFSQEMVKIAEYKNIDHYILEITIIPGPQSDLTLLGFNWTVTDFGTDTLEIKLAFENPLEVSTIEVTNNFNMVQSIDKVKVVFLQNEFFIGMRYQNEIDYLYTMQKNIPQQMVDNALAAVFDSSGESIDNGMKTVVIGNAIINIVLYLPLLT